MSDNCCNSVALCKPAAVLVPIVPCDFTNKQGIEPSIAVANLDSSLKHIVEGKQSGPDLAQLEREAKVREQQLAIERAAQGRARKAMEEARKARERLAKVEAEAEAIKTERAAIKIQAVARGNKSREEVNQVKKEHAAATKIQAIQRGKIARRQTNSGVKKMNSGRIQHNASKAASEHVRILSCCVVS